MTRNRLPPTRYGITHKFAIHTPTQGRLKGFFTVNTFPDGSPAELFIHINSLDESTRGNLRVLCLFISIALQHGMPLHSIIQKLRGQRFEPSGFSETPDIPNCTSIIDYIARWLTLNEPLLRTSGAGHTDIARNTAVITPAPDPLQTQTTQTKEG